MYRRIKIYLIALSLCSVGLMISPPVNAADTLIPVVENPEACEGVRAAHMPCKRWYSLSEKPQPDACLYRFKAKACGRWFAVLPEPVIVQPIVMREVKFDFDSSEIKAESQPRLDKEASMLKENEDKKVTIVGHTDAIGSTEYNQELSEARANSIMEYFIQKGVAPSRMVTKGHGDLMPVADNATEEGRSENRRTEMYLN